MWKFHIPGKHNERDILDLRQKFPNHVYINGSYKGKKGVYALPKEYQQNHDFGEKKESTEFDGVTYWDIAEKNIYKIDLEKYENKMDIKIPIKLGCGQELKIVPALATPRRVIFGKKSFEEKPKEEEIEFASHYNTDFDYGKKAYDMLYRYKDNDIEYKDEQLMELIETGLRFSYSLPIDVMNTVFKITEFDIDVLFFACMGSNLDFIKKGEASLNT